MKSSPKSKRVKGWVLVNERGKFIEAAPHQWPNIYARYGIYRFVPCTITYNLPTTQDKE